MPKEPFIIPDNAKRKDIAPPPGHKAGLIPRDFDKWPCGSIPGLPMRALPEFSDQEIEDRLRDQQKNKSSLYDIGQDHKIPILDQNGFGYCWAFSTTAALMYLRATQNEPMIKLSGWHPGCFVKSYRNQGGWCEQSLNHARTQGICAHELFPGPERRYDTPAMRQDATTRIVTEWSDIPEESKSRIKRMLASLMLLNVPTMTEYSRWSHSVLCVQLVSWNPFRHKIANSWTPSWGQNGFGDLDGDGWIPDNMGCPYVSAS